MLAATTALGQIKAEKWNSLKRYPTWASSVEPSWDRGIVQHKECRLALVSSSPSSFSHLERLLLCTWNQSEVLSWEHWVALGQPRDDPASCPINLIWTFKHRQSGFRMHLQMKGVEVEVDRWIKTWNIDHTRGSTCRRTKMTEVLHDRNATDCETLEKSTAEPLYACLIFFSPHLARIDSLVTNKADNLPVPDWTEKRKMQRNVAEDNVKIAHSTIQSRSQQTTVNLVWSATDFCISTGMRWTIAVPVALTPRQFPNIDDQTSKSSTRSGPHSGRFTEYLTSWTFCPQPTKLVYWLVLTDTTLLQDPSHGHIVQSTRQTGNILFWAFFTA